MSAYRRMERRLRSFFVAWIIIAAWGFTTPLLFAAEPEQAGEAAGAGRITREQEKPVGNLCAGCLAPIFTDGSRGSITPYGRIELDAIYSNRMTNPLDPGQFNGYATAAGT